MSTFPVQTVADLLASLGGVDPARIRLEPQPGHATVEDVIQAERVENRLFELVDGVLVEKVMGYRESIIAVALAGLLRAFVGPRNLGLVSGADGMMRPFARLVRIPDVAFVSWARVPGRRVPEAPVPDLVPNLAIEVLSAGNTPDEMARKLREYFAAGVEAVWLLDLEQRTARVHTAADRSMLVPAEGTLAGEPVLPGLRIPLRDVFAELDRVG